MNNRALFIQKFVSIIVFCVVYCLSHVLSLFTKSGMLFLEVSLIAFLLQGNDASGFESLARTFVISGVVVAADVLLKV